MATPIRASGGIGRRAGFRCQCPKGRGGSTPPSRTAKIQPPTWDFPGGGCLVPGPPPISRGGRGGVSTRRGAARSTTGGAVLVVDRAKRVETFVGWAGAFRLAAVRLAQRPAVPSWSLTERSEWKRSWVRGAFRLAAVRLAQRPAVLFWSLTERSEWKLLWGGWGVSTCRGAARSTTGVLFWSLTERSEWKRLWGGWGVSTCRGAARSTTGGAVLVVDRAKRVETFVGWVGRFDSPQCGSLNDRGCCSGR